MTRSPITIKLHSPLHDALRQMTDNGIKHLPVLSSDGHLVGVVTDRDCRLALNSPYILHESWQDEELVSQLEVRAVMSPAPIIVEPAAPAAEAARLMLTHRIGCLPVMRAETLVGIITKSDLLVAFMTYHKRFEALVNSRG